MAVTRDQFYVRFDVFDLTDYTTTPSPTPNTKQDAKVDANLAAAEALNDRTIFVSTAQADEAVMYLTAHMLAQDPSSMNARLQKSRGAEHLVTDEDIYWKNYRRVARAASSGYRNT